MVVQLDKAICLSILLKSPFVQDICILAQVLITALIPSLLPDRGIPMIDLAPQQVSVTNPSTEIKQQEQFQEEGSGCLKICSSLMFYSAKGSLLFINVSQDSIVWVRYLISYLVTLFKKGYPPVEHFPFIALTQLH